MDEGVGGRYIFILIIIFMVSTFPPLFNFIGYFCTKMSVLEQQKSVSTLTIPLLNQAKNVISLLRDCS